MKRKITRILCSGLLLCLFINNGYSLFGTETWTTVVKEMPCQASGSAAAAIAGGAGSIDASIQQSDEVVYAHYAYSSMSCPGWAWGCFDAGVDDKFLGVVRSCP